MSDLRNVAVILAGGTGLRVGSPIPKQLIEIAGRTVIEHTMAAFQAARGVDEIVIVMAPGHLGSVRKVLLDGRYDKVTQLLEGGSTRSESATIALEAIGGRECNVLLHDAARPLVSQRIISDVVDALSSFDAVVTSVPVTDTIAASRPRGQALTVEDIVPRQALRRNQTPQAFRRSVIAAAYERAWEDPEFSATDDCSVVVRYMPQVTVALVPGEERNMKVTGPTDVQVAELLMQVDAQGNPR